VREKVPRALNERLNGILSLSVRRSHNQLAEADSYVRIDDHNASQTETTPAFSIPRYENRIVRYRNNSI
jgi:hypothetical protein